MAGYIGSKAVSVNTTSATISDDLAVGDDLTVTDDATIGGLLTVTGGTLLNGTTPTLTIGDAGAEDAKIVFDGNAADYHIGLDDSEDALQIGLGSALGTTPRITIRAAEVVANDLGIDLDFRVEGNGLTHALFVDGETDNVMIGTSVAGRAAEGADRLTIADASHSGLTIRSGVNAYGSINFSDSEGGVGEYAGSVWFGHGNLGNKLVVALAGVNTVTAEANGDLTIEDGNLVVGTAGHGIDFSATGNISGTGSELLDDYEEGTHGSSDGVTNIIVPNTSGTVTLGFGIMGYTKIGREVFLSGEVVIGSVSSPVGGVTITLPFPQFNAANSNDRQAFTVSKPGVYNINLPDNSQLIMISNSDNISTASLVFEQDNGTFLNYTPAAGDTLYINHRYYTSA